MTPLRTTPLTEAHRRRGARLVPFAGFEMPVQYESILAEHRAAREAAALFDVSHMGQIWLEGPGAVASAERIATCRIEDLRPGRVRYGCLCRDDGGTLDDVTVYRVEPERLFLCVNAANVEKDHAWCRRQALPETRIADRSDETALLALQGPGAQAALAPLADAALDGLQRFRFVHTRVAGRPCLVSRTGYTGSDGFEIYAGRQDAEALWESLLGQPEQAVRPAGLGARDTLRLEAALPLYGHELDEATTPLEAGLERFVKLERGGFVGAGALRRQHAEGPRRRLVGFELEGRGVARAGYTLARAGEKLGVVTSGAPSPTLGKSIGLGYVPPAEARLGAQMDVMVRGRPVAARVVETPFVRAR